MIDTEHVLDLLPAYSLGSLEEEETIKVSEHLSGCSLCQSEFASYQAVSAQLALAGVESDPPPDLKNQLFDQLGIPPSITTRESSSDRPRLAPRLLSVWSLASLILIIALAVGSIYMWQRINRLEQAARPGGMYSFALNGTDDIPGAAGYLIVGADGRNGAIIVDKLPPLDAEFEYQLWLTRDGEFTSGALLAVDEMGYSGRRVSAPDNLLTYSAASVTVEPAGGSNQPTGDIVLVGTLSRP
jgi:anti-sigma-K factor RskA